MIKNDVYLLSLMKYEDVNWDKPNSFLDINIMVSISGFFRISRTVLLKYLKI